MQHVRQKNEDGCCDFPLFTRGVQSMAGGLMLSIGIDGNDGNNDGKLCWEESAIRNCVLADSSEGDAIGR